MSKILKTILLVLSVLIFSLNVKAEDGYNKNVLKAGVSLIEQVPNSFFGVWRVNSALVETNSAESFRKENIDLWNLSREADVINLSNPFTGASASITLSHADKRVIRFSRKSDYDGKILTDTVEIYLNGENFTGVNTISLETVSDIDNSVIKTNKATYTLKGEKIAGMSILGK